LLKLSSNVDECKPLVAGLFTDEILARGLLRTTTRPTLCSPSSTAHLYEHSP